MFSSSFHIEITPSEMGNMDRLIIQDIIKEFSSSKQIIESTKKFKVVIIFEADFLSKDAQHALRRTMEKYATYVRFIFVADNFSKILSPIKSRCLSLQCPSISQEDFQNISINSGKHFNKSFGSLRRNLLSINQKSPSFWWEDCISKLFIEISSNSSNSLSNIRSILYQLTSNSIPKKEIIRVNEF